MTRILRIDASARRQGSASRGLTDRVIARFGRAEVTTLDLAETAIPHLTEAWVAGSFAPAEARTDAQRSALALSDRLVEQLRNADVLVIGLGVYNFGVPSSLKAWVDQVTRAGESFRYTETGPEGLLTGKRAVIAVASGGTPAGAPHDFAVSYLRHILGFIGITDVAVVDAAGIASNAKAAISRAEAEVDALLLGDAA